MNSSKIRYVLKSLRLRSRALNGGFRRCQLRRRLFRRGSLLLEKFLGRDLAVPARDGDALADKLGWSDLRRLSGTARATAWHP